MHRRAPLLQSHCPSLWASISHTFRHFDPLRNLKHLWRPYIFGNWSPCRLKQPGYRHHVFFQWLKTADEFHWVKRSTGRYSNSPTPRSVPVVLNSSSLRPGKWTRHCHETKALFSFPPTSFFSTHPPPGIVKTLSWISFVLVVSNKKWLKAWRKKRQQNPLTVQCLLPGIKKACWIFLQAGIPKSVNL